MRVALLSDCYLPRLGGIESQVHDLAHWLKRAGHHVEVFTATPGEDGSAHGAVDVIDGVRVHRTALRLPWQLPVNPLAPRLVRRRLVEGGFDVAHVHMGVVSPYATDMASVALDLHLPTVVTWHCVIDRTAPLFSALGHARRWGERGAALNAVSEMAAGDVRRIVPRSVPVTVLHDAIDLAAWAPEPLPAPGPVRIVTAMRLAPRKRARALLGHLQRVRELVPADREIALEVIGDGPLMRPLLEEVRRRGMQTWVTFPGRVTRAELRDRYAASHVYVSPARQEAFGMATIEARAVGLPVVARRGTGADDFVIDEVEGLLVEDDDELVAALARLVTDDALRDKMRSHNASTPPPQAWPTVIPHVLAEYHRAGVTP